MFFEPVDLIPKGEKRPFTEAIDFFFHASEAFVMLVPANRSLTHATQRTPNAP